MKIQDRLLEVDTLVDDDIVEVSLTMGSEIESVRELHYENLGIDHIGWAMETSNGRVIVRYLRKHLKEWQKKQTTSA